jgi:hypothetical protein
VISDLPGGLPAGTPVDVSFTYGDDGRLTVKASLPTLKRVTTLVIERASGLSDAHVEQWERQVTKNNGPLNLDAD